METVTQVYQCILFAYMYGKFTCYESDHVFNQTNNNDNSSKKNKK